MGISLGLVVICYVRNALLDRPDGHVARRWAGMWIWPFRPTAGRL
ncbi:hypothetical protein [Streptomyces vastus]